MSARKLFLEILITFLVKLICVVCIFTIAYGKLRIKIFHEEKLNNLKDS